MKDWRGRFEADAKAIHGLKQEAHTLAKRAEEIAAKLKEQQRQLDDQETVMKNQRETISAYEKKNAALHTDLAFMKAKIGTALYDEIRKLAAVADEAATAEK